MFTYVFERPMKFSLRNKDQLISAKGWELEYELLIGICDDLLIGICENFMVGICDD